MLCNWGIWVSQEDKRLHPMANVEPWPSHPLCDGVMSQPSFPTNSLVLIIVTKSLKPAIALECSIIYFGKTPLSRTN